MISDENLKKKKLKKFNMNAFMYKHDKTCTHNKIKECENSTEKQRSEILVKNLHS